MLETPYSLTPRSGKVVRIGQSADKSYAYLLGVYLGDGCVTEQRGKNVFRLNTIDMDFALATKAAIEDLGYTASISTHAVKKSSKPNNSLYCGSVALCERLVMDCDGKSRIPEFRGPIEAMAFIEGVMDSEGFVAEKTQNKTGRAYYMGFKSCDVWVPKLVSLMQSVGLKIGKRQTEKPRQPHYKAPTRFHIKMQSWVNSGLRFNIQRKQQRVDRWAATVPYSERSRYPRKLISETAREAAICG